MSSSNKSSSKNDKIEDIWTRIAREQPPLTNNTITNVTDDKQSQSTNSTVLFVGELGCGKSTLIQGFLKPSAGSNKDIKPTIALEYNFARKTVNNLKSVANIWELGGDMLDPKLVEVAINMKSFSNCSVVICCDLSKPHNIVSSLLRSINIIKEVIAKRANELQSSNNNLLTLIREKVSARYASHPDARIFKPSEVPIFIIGNKMDGFRNLPSSYERRSIAQVLRFIAHYYGATLITTSSNDATLRDSFRTLLSSICFNSIIKNNNEINPEKNIFITHGEDSFQNILMDNRSEGDAAKGRSQIQGIF
eukprot:gene14616-19627_t